MTSSDRQQEIATPSRKKSPGRIVAEIASMVALSVVLKIISNNLSVALPQSLKLSLSYLGWYLSAAITGPLFGGAIAAVSDLTGQWIFPTGGAPNPILILGNALSAFIFGLAFKRIKFRKLPVLSDLILRSIIGAVAAALVCTLGVNTFGIWAYYYSSTDYFAFTLTRLPQLIMVAINVALFAVTLPVLVKLNVVSYAIDNRKSKADFSYAAAESKAK